MAADTWPTLFIPHGGGPCFFMESWAGWPSAIWDRMAAFLCGLDASLGRRPRAVLVISAHWETKRPTVNVSAHPPLLFDYYGFPEHTYQLTYPAKGAPDVTVRVLDLLSSAGFKTDTENGRGLDHGVFVPFKLIYPDADVPVLQLSLQHDLDPAIHLAIGRALAPLRDEGVLIVGSGMSYHNPQGFFSGRGEQAADVFDAWLSDAVTDRDVRNEALVRWRQAPGSEHAHPRAEHLMPLMVIAGAADGEPGARVYTDRILGKPFSGFRFG